MSAPFDLFSVMRQRRLGNCTFDQMVASINDPFATEAERRQRRDDYLDDLRAECEAAGIITPTKRHLILTAVAAAYQADLASQNGEDE